MLDLNLNLLLEDRQKVGCRITISIQLENRSFQNMSEERIDYSHHMRSIGLQLNTRISSSHFVVQVQIECYHVNIAV